MRWQGTHTVATRRWLAKAVETVRLALQTKEVSRHSDGMNGWSLYSGEPPTGRAQLHYAYFGETDAAGAYPTLGVEFETPEVELLVLMHVGPVPPELHPVQEIA